MLPVNIDVHDSAKLQRGAKIFMNYCSGCHALRYMRYNRMAEDLGLTTFTGEIDKDLLFNNLIFTSAKIHDPIKISMAPADARQWFGIVPPDLSLTARERSPEWIYTYLKSFYEDKKKPFGTNNLLVPDVAMPNILEPLIGRVIAVRENQGAESSGPHLVLVQPGEMNPRQFDSMLEDLITFLTYVAEPVKLVRYRLGVFVILFLCVFLLIAYLLKRTYWKKIH
nr:cytochrome c1 [Legionella jamestowniensis]